MSDYLVTIRVTVPVQASTIALAKQKVEAQRLPELLRIAAIRNEWPEPEAMPLIVKRVTA